jgi:hypothetical protein
VAQRVQIAVAPRLAQQFFVPWISARMQPGRTSRLVTDFVTRTLAARFRNLTG